MSLNYRITLNFFFEPSQKAKSYWNCKREIINSHTIFQYGYTFHLSYSIALSFPNHARFVHLNSFALADEKKGQFGNVDYHYI